MEAATAPRPQPTLAELAHLSRQEEAALLDAEQASPKKLAFKFKLMTWNILAQCLIKRDQFPYITGTGTENPLSTKIRSPLILRAFDLHAPHIAALQEVCIDQWTHHLEKGLQARGYDFAYVKKDPTKKAGHGLAIVWKRDMFSMLGQKDIHFDDHPLTHPTPITPITGNIGVVVALKYLPQGAMDLFDFGVIVSNHHLFWWPKAKYEKLRQVYVLLEEVESFRKQALMGWERWPHAMCGDFNTTPSDALYRVLTSSSPLSPDLIASLEPVPLTKPQKGVPSTGGSKPSSNDTTPCISDSVFSAITPTAFPSVPFLLDSIARKGPFHSAYSLYRTHDPAHPDISTVTHPWDGEPSYTSVDEWRGTLDYLMVKRGGVLRALRVLKIPDPRWLEPGLPNLRFPSDHVPLMAEMGVERE
ncbi:Endonuclease/exonuclease/phosphatase [Chytriomyces sp. MP71]|nr:Endonuclease/exonuclease/phosphatase [Chytriomyces sp. MP71]